MLEGYGLQYTNIKADYLSFSEIVQQLKNQTIDAGFINASYPVSAIMDLDASVGVKLIPIEPDRAEAIQALDPNYFPTVLPGGTYKSIPADLPTMGVGNLLICREGLEEELVYELTKLLFERRAELETTHQAATRLSLDRWQDVTIPLHPGAGRFFKEQETSATGAKQQSPARDRLRSLLVSALAIGLGLFHLYSARFGELVAYQHRAVHVAGMLALAFLISSKSKGKRRFVSDILATLSLVVGTYFVVAYKSIALRPGVPGGWDLVAAAAVLVLVLEASRRVLGPTLPILSVGFLLYTHLGDYVPGRFGHRGYSVSEILEYTSLTTEGIFGVALGVSSTYIVLFILFGAFLEKTGLMDFFNETALALAGRTRGGVAKVSVVSSALLGTINGSAIANVVTVGSFTIPLMKRSGFSPAYAAAVEATASMGGQLMPPIMGVAAFIMADMLAIPYLRIATAAIIPAFLYFFAAGAMIHFRASREGHLGLSREELPRLGPLLLGRGYLLLPVAVLLYFLFAGYTPTYAAVYSILFAIAVSAGRALLDARNDGKIGEAFRRRGVAVSDLVHALERGVRNAVPVAIACAVVGIIVGAVTQTGSDSSFRVPSSRFREARFSLRRCSQCSLRSFSASGYPPSRLTSSVSRWRRRFYSSSACGLWRPISLSCTLGRWPISHRP